MFGASIKKKLVCWLKFFILDRKNIHIYRYNTDTEVSNDTYIHVKNYRKTRENSSMGKQQQHTG